MRKFFAICCFALTSLVSLGQPGLSALTIPEEMKEKADAVVLHDETKFVVNSIGEATLYKKFSITILKPQGKRYATSKIYYDKLSPVLQVNAKVYGPLGNVIKKIKKSEIKDYSIFDGFSLYSDNRAKYIDMKQNSYPYTVEVEYEQLYDGLLYMEDWDPVIGLDVGVLHSEYKISVPKNLNIRFLSANTTEPIIVKTETSIEYNWSADSIQPVKYEPYSTDLYENTPQVKVAPNSFEIEGYTGRMDSWKEMGIWQNKLLEGRNDLSDEHLHEIRKLVSNEVDPKKITQIVYEYLQKNTRYVSIQLGIGGWQPFHASSVAEKGYGDCKALTNYTKNVLESFGISSLYTLVKAGAYEKNVNSSFPSRQFNHAFLCVPFDKDTVWLECTSQTNPFNYLGKFTSNRNVLVIDEGGGKIVRTPAYSKEENATITKIEINLDEEGHATASLQSDFLGLSSDQWRSFDFYDEKERRDELLDYFDLDRLTIVDYNLSQKKVEIPQANLTTSFTVQAMARKSGKRYFLRPNLINRIENTPDRIEERLTNFQFKYPKQVMDSIVFNLPDNLHTESLPNDQQFDTPYGSYKVSYKASSEKLIYCRSLELKEGIYDKGEYQKFVEFFENCAKADKQKVVFVDAT